MDRNIILLFGGDSDERLVSVASAQFMAQSIRCSKLWFWHHNGSLFDVDYDTLIQHDKPFTNEFKPSNNPIFNRLEDALLSELCDDHVFLLGVHGGFGENGDLQAVFERHKRPYTGSDAQSSRLAFNKILTKERLKDSHIKMAPHIGIDTASKDAIKPHLLEFFMHHGDTIVKPVCGGSSIGTFYIRSEEDVALVADELLRSNDRFFLAEKVIVGREITIGVVEDDDGPFALPCTEILLEKDRDFDYEGKYLGHGSKEITPAALDTRLFLNAQQIAVLAHTALGLYGYSRADLILSDNEFYFLETNTLPGMSKQSLVPQQLAAAGISLEDFLHDQVELALKRMDCQSEACSHSGLDPESLRSA